MKGRGAIRSSALKIAFIFLKNGVEIFRYEEIIMQPGDLAEAGKSAFEAFRNNCPNVSLLDDAITIRFDRA